VDADNIQEVEDDILDCIRIEDPVNEIEDGILATYLPNEADEPEADIPLAIPPPVTPHEALAHIEGLYKSS